MRARSGRVARLAAFLAALGLVACAAPGREPAAGGLADHHVHLLGPGLVRDWKALGIELSRPDEAYTSAERFFAGEERLQRALLVPMAHVYGARWMRERLGLTLEEELARVRAENEHVAREAARLGGRARALAAVDLLRPYALEELARMRREHAVSGAKLHLGSAGFDARDEEQLARLERIAAWCEGEGLLLLLHLDTQAEGLEPADVERILARALGPHPRLLVVIPHLGGSGGFGPRTRMVLEGCARWLEAERARGEARAGLFLDLSAVPLPRESEGLPATSAEELELLAPALRRVGLGRLLFGSDAPVFDPFEHARLLRERSGLAQEELQLVLGTRLELR